jgi:3-hydroxyacyl-CoA dehydrogenase
MREFVRVEVINGVAVLTVDNPPVNALGPGVIEAIDAAATRADDDPSIVAIVLVGAGRTFIAGADIHVFTELTSAAQAIAMGRAFHAALNHFEDRWTPTVAAIHGSALGGGLEVALACHYRVCTPDARLGLPETQLGIIPGGGGTQRLPRLVGTVTALEMCTTGQSIAPRRALTDGLIDRIVDGDLVAGAVRFALEQAVPGGPRPTRLRNDKIADRAAAVNACAIAHGSLDKAARGARAPHQAVDAIEAAAMLPFDQGTEQEIEIFSECVLSTESRALVHLFFAEREVAKIPDVPRDTPVADVSRIAVVGAGTMGAGIAMVYANAGIPVVLLETSQGLLDRGLAGIRRTYESSLAKGRLSREELEARLLRITTTLTYDTLADVDLVVEAVFEDMEVKKSVFETLGRVTRPDCLLASNTSTLDIDAFASASGRPDRVIGHHFFSPAHVMKLLEIVRGRETSRKTIATSMALARKLGKIGVVVGNSFGFVANRLLAFYRREALLLLEEGTSVECIDRALTDFGMPVGVFAMQDIAGLDVGVRVRRFLRDAGRTFPPGPESDIPERLFALGHYGQKTGAGWYRYESGSRNCIVDPLIDDLAAEAAARRGLTRQPVADEDIIARTMTAVINEAANILDEGMAIRPGDIDVIFCHGFGFPRHRGGPLFYGQTVGLPVILSQVKRYRDRFGDYWTPSPLLERLVGEGRAFY